jgi:hypothetical protein
MNQHPCQETYSANLEEQQAPTQPIDEVEKAAEVLQSFASISNYCNE